MRSSDYVERASSLVIDANIAVGAIIGGSDGATRRVFRQLVAARIVLLAPDQMRQEVDRHLPLALARSFARRSLAGGAAIAGQHDAAAMWHEIQLALWVVPPDEYALFEAVARKRIPRDQDDWPCVALALRMDSAILTKNLAHFAGSGLPIWTLELANMAQEE